jgi:hemerythrin-like domain-containing protein
MTRVTHILKAEHRVIEQVLDCLEMIAQKARSDGRIERDSASEVVRFLRGFADACHHGKEEDRLFPAMVSKGVPGDVGPVGVMLAEHDQGRAAVREMDALVSVDGGDPEAFATVALGFVELLRDHILKEDNILFPMADSVLSEDDQSALLGEFEYVESEEIGVGVHEEYLELADRLAQRFGVPLAEDRTTQPFQGCCHQH